MNLTNDLIRDTLLCIETKIDNFTDDSGRFNCSPQLSWKKIYEDEYLDSIYLIDGIKYCILKLREAGYINTTIYGRKDKISMLDIDCITYEGHMFLNSIKDVAIWNKIKERLGNAGKVSISIISKVATELGTSYLKNKLGIS